MNNPTPPEEGTEELSPEEFLSALFVNLIMQQTNMALMFLGKAPHPETGEVVQDFDTAKYFIDQIEMLEAKTKGNLNRKEDQILKQSLTMLRMAYVEAVGGKSSPIEAPAASPSLVHAGAPTTAPKPAEAPLANPTPAPLVSSAAPEESRVKFTKKY